ncbi:unnamed protein product [Rangifer tarandus platyrhynchus]|uniref:Basic proline-rich protein-like n=1 Tax=Rangifer tarandus platyrhynchus TaxID=3082113 RepID=A0ABN8YHM0_RANTA|nr:unnamed protein product [Rangifer tarandus platyrhynchus]
MKGLWSAPRLRKWGPRPAAVRRTAGARNGLGVPLRSLASPSPGLPGPAGPGLLQAGRLPRASHPRFPGRDPAGSPASAPRRPQLREASEPPAPRAAARPPGRSAHSGPRPHPPPPAPSPAISGSTRK